MNPSQPRTSHGPRYPEDQCSGTAWQILDMSDAEGDAAADAMSESEEEFYDLEDILD
ncbi:MAG: hypothetical protein ACREYF_10310 [Gammaproteobacteria bacterium]